MTSHVRYGSGGQILVQIAKVFLQVLQTGALGEVIREFVEIAQPSVAVLPVRKAKPFHGANLESRFQAVNLGRGRRAGGGRLRRRARGGRETVRP